MDYRSLFENAIEGVFRRNPDGTLLSANPSLAGIFGYATTDEFRNALRNGADFYVDPGRRAEILQRAEREGSIPAVESRAVRKDGRVIWISENVIAVRGAEGRLTCFDGTVQDITQRRMSEDALRRQTAAVKLLEEVAVAANSNESVESAVQFALDRVCAHASWPVGHAYVLDSASGELHSMKLWHLDRPGSFEEFRKVSEGYRFKPGIGLPGRVLESGRPAWIMDVMQDSNFPRSGLATELGVGGAFGFPVLSGDEVTGVLEFFTDKPAPPDAALLEIMGHVGTQLGRVFERQRSERRLRLAKTAAEAANTAKSRFLANMSHELRTPLNSVIGFANILLKNPSGAIAPDQITYLERIRANGKHLLGLIDQILDLSKVEAGEAQLKVAPIDVGALVRETVEQLRGQVGERPLRFQVDVPDGLRVVETDSDKLRQVLINLLGNALRFTEEGSITVRIEADEQTHRPQRIDVIDTGIGIPADRLEIIFEAFQQADTSASRRFGGTGLGLTISRTLCRLMGYRLQVESELGRGSTFSILMPGRP